MIRIIDKEKCCGCSACVQSCPKQCISFEEDEQGFCYPLVNSDNCIECGLCEKVCPVINIAEPQKTVKVFAARNNDEKIRLASSSGGVFSLLAESVIKAGGVVFGARFNDSWEVVHDYTESLDGIKVFRGSKYVQSVIGESYKNARDFLEAGRTVLFSGTPCQIAGLNGFLRKKYDNLITVDVVCHGVPSPLVWRTYLSDVVESVRHENEGYGGIEDISFRDKSRGWRNFSFSVKFKTEKNSHSKFIETKRKNVFLRMFLQNLILRPSCYACQMKGGRSFSDFTIADFWSVASYLPHMDDDKGTSLVLMNSTKASNLFDSLVMAREEVGYEWTVVTNSPYWNSVEKNEFYDSFWKQFVNTKLNDICIPSRYRFPKKKDVVILIKRIVIKLTPRFILSSYYNRKLKKI